jgi:hypothetical protein
MRTANDERRMLARVLRAVSVISADNKNHSFKQKQTNNKDGNTDAK